MMEFTKKNNKKKVRALGLFSGGLDSILAVKLLTEQGIDVRLVKFSTNYFSKKEDTDKEVIQSAEKLGIQLKIIDISKEYLKVLKSPEHGFGSGFNPCIDCKIFMLRQAKKYARKIKADFIFTGEVLGERPMSQTGRALKIIESEAGLRNKILRPLSAKIQKKTSAEIKGLVDREKLWDIQGRGRKKQFILAEKFGVKEFPQPSGGCLLAEKEFARKAFDLVKYNKRFNDNDLESLKFGRHFRYKKNKIIVGRNQEENLKLSNLRNFFDYKFDVLGSVGPITLLRGKKSKDAVRFAAELTLSYSDCKEKKATVKYGRNLEKRITVKNKPKKDFLKDMV